MNEKALNFQAAILRIDESTPKSPQARRKKRLIIQAMIGISMSSLNNFKATPKLLTKCLSPIIIISPKR